MIRVLVADDQALVRGGFRIMLEQQDDLEVCGEAATGAEAVQLARELNPDVVLMDIRMPQLDGLEVTRQITARLPRTRVLVLTTYDLDEYVVTALRQGASGYLLKDVRPAELIRCVRAVAAGETSLSQPVLQRIVHDYVHRSTTTDGAALIERLSQRERDVLAEVARGLTNAEIGVALSISAATVKTHVAGILAKLGLRDRVQAVILAYESGFAG